MGRIILVSGGSRSGKSGYAQKMAESIGEPRLFTATCPRIDTEIDDRIKKHILDRQGKRWKTLEEEIDLGNVIRNNHEYVVILIDCLTLWINNLLFNKKSKAKPLCEEDIVVLSEQILKEARIHNGTIIFVTNEVGSGIVPESSESRLYRDLVGRCNQCIASSADEVILVSCGVPLTLKSD